MTHYLSYAIIVLWTAFIVGTYYDKYDKNVVNGILFLIMLFSIIKLLIDW